MDIILRSLKVIITPGEFGGKSYNPIGDAGRTKPLV